MTLLQSWVDSLTLLKPKHLQLFVMVTIKSIIEAYKLYFKYFWWLLLAMPLFLFVGSDIKYTTSSLLLFFSYLFGRSLLHKLPFLAACFATRPSILQKDCAYFRTQFKKNLLWLFMDFVIALLIVLFFIGMTRVLSPAQLSWLPLVAPFLSFFVVFFQWSVSVFFVLFFTDSDGGLKNYFLSLWSALKMNIYNLPLICIINICFFLPVIFFNYVFIAPWMHGILRTLLMPIGVCTYTNIYIKRLHDQFDLYFKQP